MIPLCLHLILTFSLTYCSPKSVVIEVGRPYSASTLAVKSGSIESDHRVSGIIVDHREELLSVEVKDVCS